MAVLQFVPGHPRVLIFYTTITCGTRRLFPNGDITFPQGTLQLVNASVRTLYNNNMMSLDGNVYTYSKRQLLKENPLCLIL